MQSRSTPTARSSHMPVEVDPETRIALPALAAADVIGVKGAKTAGDARDVSGVRSAVDARIALIARAAVNARHVSGAKSAVDARVALIAATVSTVSKSMGRGLI